MKKTNVINLKAPIEWGLRPLIWGFQYDLSYADEKDMARYTDLKKICSTISRTLRKDYMETHIRFYKLIALRILLYGTEYWVPRQGDLSVSYIAEWILSDGSRLVCNTDVYRSQRSCDHGLLL